MYFFVVIYFIVILVIKQATTEAFANISRFLQEVITS